MYAFVLFPSILNTLSQETVFYNIFLPIVNVLGGLGLDNVLVIKSEAAGKLDDFVLKTLFWGVGFLAISSADSAH